MCRGFGTQWDVFFDQIEELATQVPTMVVVGNHERDWPGTHDRFLDAGYDSGETVMPSLGRSVQCPACWQLATTRAGLDSSGPAKWRCQGSACGLSEQADLCCDLQFGDQPIQ